MRPIGVGVDAHAALFLHHVALLVELALDRMRDALALEVGPKLKPVGGHASRSTASSLLGRGIQIDSAVLLGDLGELVGDDILLRGGLSILKGLLQLSEFGRILADAFAVLVVVGRVGGLDFGERDLFCGVVRGADLGGTLEGHVLEHVSEAACAQRIVRRARIDQRVEAEDRGFGTLTDDQREAIGKHLHRGSPLEAREVLRAGDAAESEAEGKDCKHTFERTLGLPPEELQPKVLLYRSPCRSRV